MKRLKCAFCGLEVGEINKGKMLMTARNVCAKCFKNVKTWQEMATKYKPQDDGLGMFRDMLQKRGL